MMDVGGMAVFGVVLLWLLSGADVVRTPVDAEVEGIAEVGEVLFVVPVVVSVAEGRPVVLPLGLGTLVLPREIDRVDFVDGFPLDTVLDDIFFFKFGRQKSSENNQ